MIIDVLFVTAITLTFQHKYQSERVTLSYCSWT